LILRQSPHVSLILSHKIHFLMPVLFRIKTNQVVCLKSPQSYRIIVRHFWIKASESSRTISEYSALYMTRRIPQSSFNQQRIAHGRAAAFGIWIVSRAG
jgi:hypothetical protein